jgi:hypothetical protein
VRVPQLIEELQEIEKQTPDLEVRVDGNFAEIVEIAHVARVNRPVVVIR